MLWEVQKPVMGTGQTRTYPFLQKDKTAWCLPVLMFYKLRSRPPLSLFPLKNAIHFTAALLRLAGCYRRTFPPSISRMTVFNAIWKIHSRKDWWWQRLAVLGAAVRWMAYFDATGFVLIVSSCISHNQMCYEKNRSLLWALGRRGHIPLRGQDRCLSACSLGLMALFHFALFLVSSPDHPTPFSSVIYPVGLRRRLSDGITAIRYWRLSPVQR